MGSQRERERIVKLHETWTHSLLIHPILCYVMYLNVTMWYDEAHSIIFCCTIRFKSLTWASSTSAFFFEQSSQHTQSHSLQWCCRLKRVNLNSHNQQIFSLSFWLSLSFPESFVLPLPVSTLPLLNILTSNVSSLKFVWGVLLRTERWKEVQNENKRGVRINME